jgi:hypothetical protein
LCDGATNHRLRLCLFTLIFIGHVYRTDSLQSQKKANCLCVMWLEGQEMLSCETCSRCPILLTHSDAAARSVGTNSWRLRGSLPGKNRGQTDQHFLVKKRMLHASASLKLHIFYSGFSFFEEKRTKIYPNLTSSAVHATVDDGRRCRKQCIRMRSVSCLLVSYYNQSDA